MNFERMRHSARAWLFHFCGRNERARAEYARCFRAWPDAKVARVLGCLDSDAGRHDEGARWFAAAVELDPGDAETWFNLGFARERTGAFAEAAAAFAEAVRLKPALDRAWYGLALAHAARGDHAAAASALEETVRLQPLHGEAWYRLGMAQHYAGQAQRVGEVVRKLASFEPKFANQLIADSGRDDLAHLKTELPF